MTDRLLSKVAVITGADGPLGQAIAARFLDEGAKVVAFGAESTHLNRLAARAPARVLTVEGIATNPQDLRRLADTLTRRFGNIDIIVAAEQYLSAAPFVETTHERFRQAWEQNVGGSFETVRLLLGNLANGASIILFGFAKPEGMTARLSAFVAAKGAIVSLASALAAELSSQRIRVNAVSLGLLQTIHANAHLLSKEKIAILARQSDNPAKAFSKMDETTIAETALFLASEESRHINGEEIVIRDPP